VSREPLRTCIVCRKVGPKARLVRLVRAGDAQVRVDPPGSVAGRGAYVCRTDRCLRGLRAAGLSRALRAPSVVKTEVMEEVTRRWRHEPR
jgi:predicted RNA-binding protein YlxR (DUF448 family)